MTTVGQSTAALARRTLLALAVSAIGWAGAARADVGDPVDLQVVDRQTGQPLRVWRHDGRPFVAGQPGARYSLRIANHTGGRVLVVMSVDGVNILTGETAGYGQRGYIFNPYESYDVTGWRKSETEVAAFTFAPLPKSYAARTGRPLDVGVIGIAVFNERAVTATPVSPAYAPAAEPTPPSSALSEVVVTGQRAASAPAAAPPPPSRAARAAPSDSAVAEARTEKLGTAHGAREWSVATVAPFERATAYPQFTHRIEYDSFDNLVAMGVVRPPPGERWPRPFPSTPRGGGYVPDPPGGR